MDKESDVIKHQMEHTRAALTDKLELLEHKVTDSVSGAAEAVEKVRQTVEDTVYGASDTVASMKHAIQDTVASVKECARETAETVSETLDVRKQVQKHPWAMMAGATAVGFGVGVLVSRVDVPAAASSTASSLASSAKSAARSWSESPAGEAEQRVADWSETPPPPPPPFGYQQRREPASRREREESHEESPWAPAVNKLKGLAIGTLFGVLRDVLSKSVPEAISGQVGEVIDNFTTSLGGQPIAGKILPDSGGSNQEEHEETRPTDWRSTDRDWQGGSRRPRQPAMANIEE